MHCYMVCVGHRGATKVSDCHGDSSSSFICQIGANHVWIQHCNNNNNNSNNNNVFYIAQLLEVLRHLCTEALSLDLVIHTGTLFF